MRCGGAGCALWALGIPVVVVESMPGTRSLFALPLPLSMYRCWLWLHAKRCRHMDVEVGLIMEKGAWLAPFFFSSTKEVQVTYRCEVANWWPHSALINYRQCY